MDEKAQMEAAAQKMNQMNPETLKAQAAALRGMSPSEVRTMNPQMAGFSDSQILEAADQMEEVKDDFEIRCSHSVTHEILLTCVLYHLISRWLTTRH
jgi:hypothetical protein